jgi:hypothetical protein
MRIRELELLYCPTEYLRLRVVTGAAMMREDGRGCEHHQQNNAK